jgi:molybdopterin molybdotransferase
MLHNLAALGAADDCLAAGRFLSPQTALATILADVAGIAGTELVPLLSSFGRVTAKDLHSDISLPRFDNAAVDGFGLHADDLDRSAPLTLQFDGAITAGKASGQVLQPGKAVRILTGALIPTGVSAVIMEERASRADSVVTLYDLPDPGANIRRRGEDVATDTVVVAEGTVVDARHAAILAACGRSKIPVRRALRVGVLSTGDELVDPETAPNSAQLIDTNRPMLLSLLSGPSIDVVDLGIIPDDRATLASALVDAATRLDLLVTSGGVAGSDADHLVPAVLAAGGRCQAMKMALRPGKPIARGAIGSMQIVGLPGNPVAALVNFLLFVRPLIHKLVGAPRFVQPIMIARTAETFFHKPGRTEFVPVAISSQDCEGVPLLSKLSRGGSARLLPLVHASGLAEIPPGVGDLPKDSSVRFHPFTTSFAL